MLFSALWLAFVYVPIAHWVWGGGFLGSAGLLDFAGGTVVHINAGVAGLTAALTLGPRRGYGTDNLAPFDLSMAVVGMGLLWVGWFGFNGGSALGANSRAVMAMVSTHLAASAGALTWIAIEWWVRGKPSVLGMVSGAVAGLGTITPASGFVLPWHGVVIGIAAGALCLYACTTVKLMYKYMIHSMYSVSTVEGERSARYCAACLQQRRCRSRRRHPPAIRAFWKATPYKC